jgi:hypothetical protein
MQNHSNFITPPDFVDDPLLNVLVIDADWIDVENLAYWCKTAPACYNVYVYNDSMNNVDWLEKAIHQVDYIVINSVVTEITPTKNTLLKDPRTWYYGPNQYLGNTQQLSNPLDFFINLTS